MAIEGLLLIDVNLSLNELLKTASRKELEMLADIITDKGKGRISLSGEKKSLILNHKEHQTLHLATEEISQQICAFGGNTLINLVRTGSKEYQEVAHDVAEKLGAKVPKSASIIEIEELVIQKVLEEILKDEKSSNAIEQLCISENIRFDRVILKKLKKQNNKTELALLIFTAAGPYIISHILRMALMSGLGIAFRSKIMRALLFSRGIALLNPIFTALSAVWMTYDLSGPAYRVTLPAVICIATIRQEWIKSMTDFYCLELKKCL
ncbi:YaaW family protein [Pectobacterium versatile]|uniref:hypothetical protein n=1 Tax=Pectobacterium versatile TaxID=2488639 RepID=UPI001CCF0327|nr:hypothetical protein [Pectobacterium versatile]